MIIIYVFLFIVQLDAVYCVLNYNRQCLLNCLFYCLPYENGVG